MLIIKVTKWTIMPYYKVDCAAERNGYDVITGKVRQKHVPNHWRFNHWRWQTCTIWSKARLNTSILLISATTIDGCNLLFAPHHYFIVLSSNLVVWILLKIIMDNTILTQTEDGGPIYQNQKLLFQFSCWASGNPQFLANPERGNELDVRLCTSEEIDELEQSLLSYLNIEKPTISEKYRDNFKILILRLTQYNQNITRRCMVWESFCGRSCMN